MRFNPDPTPEQDAPDFRAAKPDKAISDEKQRQIQADFEAGKYFAVIPGYYYAAIFYFELAPVPEALPLGGNCNALLFRRENEPEQWRLMYRLRFYRDSKAFGSQDLKHFQVLEAKQPQTEEQAFEQATLTVAIMVQTTGQGELDVIQVGGDYLKFQEVIQRVRPKWMHFGVDLGNHPPERQ